MVCKTIERRCSEGSTTQTWSY